MAPCSAPVARVDQRPGGPRGLTAEQLTQLAAEIRTFLIEQVSQTGGHLGPNLGVVELTIAAAPRLRLADATRSSSTPATRATCTRSLTGRQDRFATLRQRHGLSGYPSRAESEHDWVENSHASTALSYADGLAKAIRQQRRGHGARLRRRRLADRRHGLGGAEQHRRPTRPAAGHPGQRQRPLLHPDRRRAGQAPDQRCGRTRATSRSWTWSSAASAGPRWSAAPRTTSCTASRSA